jgi:16S rRNA (cytosine1402-N4)-methyltransferase
MDAGICCMTSDPFTASRHVSVLPNEVLQWLDPQPGQILVDATLGAGGHTRMLAQKVGPMGRVISLDCDAQMIERTKPSLSGLPVTTVHASFDQLDDPDRGLTFQGDGPLDMRLDTSSGLSAADLLAQLDERSIADLIYQYGEERLSRRIAKAIVMRRKESPIRTTRDLAELVRRCVPRSGKIDPATRTFQALRIAVNGEMEALEMFLKILPRCLKVGGRAVIISFHSLEDRRVKEAFKDATRFEALTRKPVQAGDEEIGQNPRSRSAKLRAARKV